MKPSMGLNSGGVIRNGGWASRELYKLKAPGHVNWLNKRQREVRQKSCSLPGNRVMSFIKMRLLWGRIGE